MERHKFPGLFIALEGLDGAGISTQARFLSDQLRGEGYKTLLTKEPTNNLIGGLIRGQLSGDWKTGMAALQLLFAADRAHHLEREIIPALKNGRIVISDRYVFSSIAYGGIELSRDWLININEPFFFPDLTVILRITPERAAQRLRAVRFQFELFEEVEKRRQILKNYEWIADRFDRVKVVDAEQPLKNVAQDIFKTVKPNLVRVSRSG